MKFTRITTVFATFAAAASAHAALTIHLYDDAGNVVADYSGTLNTASSTVAGNGTIGSPTPNFILSIHSGNQILDLTAGSCVFYTLTAPAILGTGPFTAFAQTSLFPPHLYTTTGTLALGFSGSGQFAVGDTYVSGADITGSTTFQGTSLSALGFADGTAVYTLAGSGDTVTVQAGAIPEPSAYGLAGAGALSLVALIRRRRRG